MSSDDSSSSGGGSSDKDRRAVGRPRMVSSPLISLTNNDLNRSSRDNEHLQGKKADKKKSRWKFPFFKRKQSKTPATQVVAENNIHEENFQNVCPQIKEIKAFEERHAEMQKDLEQYFIDRDASSEGHSAISGEGGDDSPEYPPNAYGWVSPGSWASMPKTTFLSNEEEDAISDTERPIDMDNMWAIRIFKSLDKTDNLLVGYKASSGLAYVTVACDIETTASDLCKLLMRKFAGGSNLTRHRLYVVNRNIERLLGHDDCPVKILKRTLFNLGYKEDDQISKIARDDHSYCCRFIFREYPPPPPNSKDFMENEWTESTHAKSTLNKQIADSHNRRDSLAILSKARIGKQSAHLADVNLAVMPTLLFQNAATIELLDVSRNTLLEIPDDLFEQLVSLRFFKSVGNLFTAVPSALLLCRTLTHLDLSCNMLETESLLAFGDFVNLSELNLSCNKITRLPECLANLSLLRHLDVSSNYLVQIDACVFSMRSLINVNMSFNEICRIPAKIAQLVNLSSLMLVGNSIETVDFHPEEDADCNPASSLGTRPRPRSTNSAPGLSKLTNLDLRGNLINSIKGLETLPALVNIALDHNNISCFEQMEWPTIARLSMVHNHMTTLKMGSFQLLTQLVLGSSHISHLPDHIFLNTPNIQELYLEKNLLQSLSPSISTLSKLQTLVVHSNALCRLSLDFTKLANLKLLQLHTNNLTAIPESIWSAPSLLHLNISSNFIAEFPPIPLEYIVLGEEGSSAPSASRSTAPLASKLKVFLAADNKLGSEIMQPLRYLVNLQVLNLSCNQIFDLENSLAAMKWLEELYLSGNGITTFPDEIDKCRSLRMLFINNNRLTNLPAELGKIQELRVLDVQSNNLKYNITNWKYDWNWNFNANLQYLNLGHNHKLSLSVNATHSGEKQTLPLTSFKSMHNLRLLDVSGLLIPPESLPEQSKNVMVRRGGTYKAFTVAIADYCGKSVNFDCIALVKRHFLGQDKDHLVGLFEGSGGNFVSGFLHDSIEEHLKSELQRLKHDEDFSVALRRTFLNTNRDLSTQPVDLHHGSSACLLYFLDDVLLVANVGDTLAVLSRAGRAVLLSTKHHSWDRSERARIRNLGGYITLQGLVERELGVTRAFGHHHLLPFVNANPSVSETKLLAEDEFCLVASSSFWTVMSYQMAVDVARKYRDVPDVAVQMLRDLAIARGVSPTVKIVLVKPESDSHGLDTLRTAERRQYAIRNVGIEDQELSRMDPEAAPPSPPCAFVFTDIKNSTKLWYKVPNAMLTAIRAHNHIMRRLMRIHRGYEVKTEGDAFVIAFQASQDAVNFCVEAQRQFLVEDWPKEIVDSDVGRELWSADGKRLLYRGLSIRMGIHWGMADAERDQVARRMDYHGVNVIIAARVSALADGGQIFISEAVRDQTTTTECIHELGSFPLKGFQKQERVWIIYPKELEERYSSENCMLRSESEMEED